MFRNLLVLVSILISLTTIAQTETIIDEGIDKDIVISYKNNNPSSPDNKILELVAKAKNSNVKDYQLTYKVKEYRTVIKNTSNLQLKISIGHFVFPDNVVYLDFNIDNFLTPSLINYSYVFEDDNGNIIDSKSFRNKKFKNGAFLLKKSIPNEYESTGFKLYLSDVQLHFSSSDADKLNSFIKKVNAYYDADAQLRLIEQGLSRISTDTIELLETYLQQTIDNIAIINRIKSEKFVSSLSLNTNDPIQFKSHLGRVEVQNREIKKQLETTLNNMHIAYYKKGLQWLNRGDNNKAELFFNKSIEEKYNYAPPHVELAKLNFNKGYLSNTIDTCSVVLNTMNPDTDTRYDAVKLSERVIYVYLDTINQDLKAGNTAKGVSLLEKCKEYEKSIPGIKRFQEFDEIQAKIYEAHYNKLITKAQQLIESDNLTKAQNYVDSSSIFRNRYSTYILNAEQEHLLLKQLYSLWLEKGKSFITNNMADSALYSFTQASVICHKYEVVYCTKELDNFIKNTRELYYKQTLAKAGNLIEEEWADSAIYLLNKADTFRSKNSIQKSTKSDSLMNSAYYLKYKELIYIGEDAYSNGKNREALAYYNEALNIEKSYQIDKDTSLNRKITICVQNYIITLCEEGESLVEVLQLNDAKAKLTKAENLYSKYQLSDKESENAIESLKSKLQTGNCEKLRYKYNIQITASRKFIEQHEFIYAQNALNKADNLLKTEKNCELSDSSVIKIANEIRTMLAYQKKMISIDKKLDQNSYNGVIDEYISVSQYYKDSCKNNFGIEHKTLYDFIVSSNYSSFIDYAVMYYTEKGEYDKALQLLEILKNKELTPSFAKQSQTKLGIALARKDIELSPDSDPLDQVIQYTHEDKWYKYLRKAYVSHWRDFAVVNKQKKETE